MLCLPYQIQKGFSQERKEWLQVEKLAKLQLKPEMSKKKIGDGNQNQKIFVLYSLFFTQEKNNSLSDLK